MRYLLIALSVLLAACTGPDRNRDACGLDPWVMVTADYPSWHAEADADWLLRQPTEAQQFFADLSRVVGFFEPGTPLWLERHSDRFDGLVLVAHHETRMWTSEREVTC